MTADSFASSLEAFYGKYRELQKPVVIAWATNRNDELLSTLAVVLFETVSAKYGVPPGIPEFSEAMGIVEERLESNRMRAEGLRIVAENRKLLAEPAQKMFTVDGERVSAGVYFCQLVRRKLKEGCNIKTDTEIQRFIESNGG